MNKTQEHLLDSFIGDEGDNTKDIREYDSINLGTKVLYLERAMTQDSRTFNESLDKLYKADLEGEEKRKNLELIIAFKITNDLYFNNDVQSDEFGIFTRPALTRYFGSLGPVDTDIFKTAIKERIKSIIASLSEGHEQTIREQKQAREEAEKDIQLQTGWRNELDLPEAQLQPEQSLGISSFFDRAQDRQAPQVDRGQVRQTSQELDDIITQEQLDGMSNLTRQYLFENAEGTRTLIEYGVTVDELSDLGRVDDISSSLFSAVRYYHGTLALMDAGVTFAQLSHLGESSHLGLNQVLRDVESTLALLSRGITINELSTLGQADYNARALQDVLKKRTSLEDLMEWGVPFADISALGQANLLAIGYVLDNVEATKSLLSHGVTMDDFTTLVKRENQYESMSDERGAALKYVLTKYDAVESLMAGGVSFAEISALGRANDWALRCVLENRESTQALMTHGVTMEDFSTLGKSDTYAQALEYVLTKQDAVKSLMDKGVSFADLSSLGQANWNSLKHVLDNVKSTQTLLECGITMEELSTLGKADEKASALKSLLTNPDSPESQRFIEEHFDQDSSPRPGT